MTTREILTIQIGHYSNFIGTHWWNLQETNFSYDPETPSEINHDVLYREGQTVEKKITYTPRLLLVDLKGTLGYLSKTGTLYDIQYEEKPLVLWNEENVEVRREPETSKSVFLKSLDNPFTRKGEFLDLEDDFAEWVDYLVPRFHPRTVNVVNDYVYKSEIQPFDIFHYGRNVWNTESFKGEFADKIRNYVEECDFIQGFQVLLDCTNGFSGLGASCVQHLYDEYGKSILSFPTFDGISDEPSTTELIKIINTVLCWQHVGENSSLFSPLGCRQEIWPRSGKYREFNHIIYNPQKKYQTAAILAAALDTVSLRYRQKKYPMSVLSDLCADLNKLGRKAAAMSINLPFPMTVERTLIEVLDNFDGPLWTSLTPCCDISSDKNNQSLSLRGISEDRLKKPLEDALEQILLPAYRCSTVHEMMSLFLSTSCYASATHLTNLTTPLGIKAPYPRIFNTNGLENGNISSGTVRGGVENIAVMAGLHSGSGLSNMYESVYNQARKVRSIRRFHAFHDSGLEQDEYIESLNNLLDCKEAYEEHYI